MLVISIVGKPNVGKSTLFNRLVGARSAIVHSTAGVTRDRQAGISHWDGHKFVLVDTGGWEGLKTAGIFKKVLAQTKLAIQESDIVFHLLDRQQGWTILDDEIANYLRRYFLEQSTAKDPGLNNPELQSPGLNNPETQDLELQSPGLNNPETQNPELQSPGLNNPETQDLELQSPGLNNPELQDLELQSPETQDPGLQSPEKTPLTETTTEKTPQKQIYVLANKFDHPDHLTELGQFYQSGAKHVFPISAQHNQGLDDCLQQMVQDFKLTSTPPTAPQTGLRIALVGRPNVGKSTIANAFLGQHKHIVDTQAGTTRDSVESSFRFEGQHFTLVDTAGLRKRSQINDNLEHYSAGSTLHSIETSQVVLLIADSQQGFVEQDFRIMHFALTRGKSLVLVLNKWDLVHKDSNSLAKVEKDFYQKYPQFSFCPLVFTSATEHKRLDKLLVKAQQVFAQQNRRIPTPAFNQILDRIKTRGALPKKFKIYYGTQTQTCPPTFVFKTNSEKAPKTAVQYLENQLRLHFQFEGTPLRLRCLKH